MNEADRIKAALEEMASMAVPIEGPDDPNKVWVLCEICYEVIALTDLRILHLPLKAEMFTSPFPGRDVQPPWQPGIEYEFMLCPHCQHRFAVEEDRIRTQDGFYVVPETIQEGNDGKEEGIEVKGGKGTEGNGKKEKELKPAKGGKR